MTNSRLQVMAPNGIDTPIIVSKGTATIDYFGTISHVPNRNPNPKSVLTLTLTLTLAPSPDPNPNP